MRISDWSSDVCSSDLAHAPNAAIRRYDGRAISDAHSRGCRARVLNRKGDHYTVMQSCVGAGAGAAKQVSQRQTVTVSDALTFTLQTRGPGKTYPYCPASILQIGRPPGRERVCQYV